MVKGDGARDGSGRDTTKSAAGNSTLAIVTVGGAGAADVDRSRFDIRVQ